MEEPILLATDYKELKLFRRGKVRDVYARNTLVHAKNYRKNKLSYKKHLKDWMVFLQ